MAYDKQTFSVGQVLTAVEQNQIEENIEEVRRLHKGPSAPPQLVAGVMWIDDSSTPWLLQLYDGTDWITIGTIDAAGNIYRPDTLSTAVDAADGGPYIAITQLNISTSLSTSVWTSVGPTGSGASVIWSGLDSVPTDADWIRTRLWLESFRSTNGSTSQILYARKGGSSISALNSNQIAHQEVHATIASANLSVHDVIEATIPVDSSNIFDLFYIRTGTVFTTAAYLVEYGYNP